MKQNSLLVAIFSRAAEDYFFIQTAIVLLRRRLRQHCHFNTLRAVDSSLLTNGRTISSSLPRGSKIQPNLPCMDLLMNGLAVLPLSSTLSGSFQYGHLFSAADVILKIDFLNAMDIYSDYLMVA